MAKNEQLEKLFLEWKSKHTFDIFCKDGIVDEKNFGKDIPRVVFLLKDANVENAEESNVCENLLDTANDNGKFGKMWKVICMWAKIMEDSSIRFLDCCDDNFEIKNSIRKYLKKIAVVNVSKEHGKGVNDQDELSAKLSKSLEQYYDYTKKELDIIEPDIVICCGTYHQILNQYHKPNRELCDKVLPSGARFFNQDGKIFLEMCHPGSYVSYQTLFAYFKEVYSDFAI